MKKLFLLALFYLLNSCINKVSLEKDLYDYIPQNTVAVVQVNDFNIIKNTFNNQDLLVNLTDIKSDFKATIKAITPNNIKSPALYCFSNSGKSSLAISLIYKTDLNDSLPISSYKPILYNGFKIDKIKVASTVFYRTQMEEICYVSNSRLILENSIRNHYKEKNGLQDAVFYTLVKNIDKDAPMNLITHYDLKKFLESIFPETPLFPKMGKSWAAYDFNSKKNPFTLDGVTFINDTLPDVLSLITSMGTKQLVIPRIVPQAFTSLLTLSVNNIETLENNFKNYSRHVNVPINTINFDPFSNVDEIGWIAHNEKKALVMHLNNTNSINETLLVPTDGKKYRDISYFKGKLPKEMTLFLDAFGAPVNPNWVMLLKDFLIYGEDENIMQKIIGSFKDNKVLETDHNYLALKESFADNSTFLWIGNSKKLKEHWQTLKENSIPVKWNNIDSDQYPLIGVQAVGENNFTQFRITAQSNNPKQSKNSTVSQYNFNLDAAVLSAPKWLKNHRNKTMDVVVQDINNVLYLFSNTGTLFWKKELPGKIIGDIKQVDLYKNGRLQMAFRTENRFMILDRNGRIVAPFNLEVPDELPIQPLAVFDYDQNRKYRFLLSQGKSLLMYDGNGKKVSGFKLKSLQYPLMQPPKHIRLDSKDFILLQQNDGNLRVVSRTGKDRIRLNEKINFSNNAIFSYLNTFTTTDIYGNLVQIDPKGNVTRTPKVLNQNHSIDMTSKSFVSLSENTLTIKGIPVNLPFGNYTRPKIFYVNNIIFVSTTDTSSQKVYLYLSNGSAVGGFPVYGNSTIDIVNADDDSALEVVVQSDNSDLLIYQINL